MTELEISRALRRKYLSKPAAKRRLRKQKLRMRYPTHEELKVQIARTSERFFILLELYREKPQ